MTAQIQLRRDTAAAWTAANPVLAAGEIGVETDTRRHKVGDGATAWTSLAYANTGVLLIENGASVPAGTPAGTLVFEKA